jgi:hypothetical protein
MIKLIIKKVLKIALNPWNKLKKKIKKFLEWDIIARPSTIFLKDYFKNNSLVGVEIGVFKGNNAKSLLKTLNIKKLYLIDSYEKIYIKNEEIKPGMIKKSEYSFFIEKETNFSVIVLNFEKSYEIAKENLKQFNNKVKFIIKKSEEAVEDIPDNIDFIYIDGNHSYEYVKKDIELYFPKLKKSGILSGHDFSAEYPGVAKAVLEFSNKNNLKINGFMHDWWIKKN